MFLKIYLLKNSVISFIKENEITIRKQSQYSQGGYFLLEENKNKINKIDNILNLNDEINIDKYLSKEEYNYLLELYSSIKQKIKKEYIVGWDSNTAIYLSNATIENFKKTVEANTNLKTIPSSTGLTDYIKNRLNLEKNINLILNTFDNKFDKETKMLGLLEEGKKLFIEKSVKMYNSTTKAPFFKTIFL